MNNHKIVLEASFFTMVVIAVADTCPIYGQLDRRGVNATDSPNIQNISVKKVHVGDIDIAYKILGKGKPILLISGASSYMNAWEPSTLRSLSSNHTVIVFDSRGVGNTTTGSKP